MKKNTSSLVNTDLVHFLPRIPSDIVFGSDNFFDGQDIYIRNTHEAVSTGGWTVNEKRSVLKLENSVERLSVIFPSGRMIKRSPLKSNAWLSFAVKDPSEKRMLKLIEKYGFLLHDPMNIDDQNGDAVFGHIGESLSTWEIELNTLYIAKNVYKFWKDRDIEAARSFLPKANERDYWFNGYSEIFGSMSAWSHMTDDGRHFDDLISAASYEQLMRVVVTAINPRVTNMTVVAETNSRGAQMKLFPQDLNTAVWMQFMQFVCGEKTFRNCVHCREDFIPIAGAHRDRMYCEPKCKTAAHRAREK